MFAMFRNEKRMRYSIFMCLFFALLVFVQPICSDPGDSTDGKAAGLPHPFPRRIKVPEFPVGMQWINSPPLQIKDLRGKFVLMDFWTYCCINCIHVLPELKKLEKAYPTTLVVIGVHSAKFDAEKDTQNIKEAVLRYEIEHPVLNDLDHQVWNTYGVRSWPTYLLVDPEGNFVGGGPGEFKFEQIDEQLKKGLPYYRKKGLLDETPVRFDLASYQQERSPLRFPGKLLADENSDRLFISDSNHNRIVISRLDGTLIETIGTGQIGHQDGRSAQATFHHPQGMALKDQLLYVADTENHLIRKVDLNEGRVTTIAGTNEQAKSAWPGFRESTSVRRRPKRWFGKPLVTAINSPWDLWIHEEDLYIAMAGPHQIWKMSLDESRIGPYAGNGREDIVDGPLLPRQPYAQGFASFAQPSGLSSDGQWLFVADSEGSSIRAVPFDPDKPCRTLVGTSQLPGGRLFAFGDVDSDSKEVTLPSSLTPDRGLPETCLQHPLGVVYHDERIYVTDTYNNKVKVVDPTKHSCRTLAGTGDPGKDDSTGTFDEPSGITYARQKLYVADTNNHVIRTIDLAANNVVQTLEIHGLKPPQPPEELPNSGDFPGAEKIVLDDIAITPKDGKIAFQVDLAVPPGWKLNPLAPMSYVVRSERESGAIDRSTFGKSVSVDPPASSFRILLTADETGDDTLTVSTVYYYCQISGTGLCKVAGVSWTVPLKVSDTADEATVSLRHQVGP